MGSSKVAVVLVYTILASQLCQVLGKYRRVPKLPTTCSKEVIQDNILKACLYKRSVSGTGAHHHQGHSAEFDPYADEAYVISELLQAENSESDTIVMKPSFLSANYRTTRGRSQTGTGPIHQADHSYESQFRTSHGFAQHRQIRKQRLASIVHQCCERECTKDAFSDYCSDLD